ncbi:hypothetical protein CEUSTIGMA_g2255.t1 [Chlamydomonas eustigma]|uniref:PHD finger protein ING n=1 Tax=Chlamydomonas eustigma TaxID=1157962 RepID=A0A250WVF9_9CHLO|nr:hypothetical protein CEUSTIGMA_g2255.t1 [Chlamydomonas eustigma]|eukprot:GAX74808.1 hypothetical protein CEUSTIGMA_g2255.t1 [Chlamydomonas eustigma]
MRHLKDSPISLLCNEETFMSSANYLKNYVERVQDVPAYLRRHLALIRDLDEKVQGLQTEIEQHSSSKKKSAPKNYDLESQVTRLVSLADEKVTIAAQIYDFIDKHIQSLDEDLRNLEAEIKNDKERLGMGEDESATLKLESTKNKGRGGRGSVTAAALAAAEGVPEKKKRGRKRTLVEEEDDGTSLLPLHAENEPLYCYCQKPSQGEMVACDNEECALEWFHYECVGLKAAPVGEWLCPDCAKVANAISAVA